MESIIEIRSSGNFWPVNLYHLSLILSFTSAKKLSAKNSRIKSSTKTNQTPVHPSVLVASAVAPKCHSTRQMALAAALSKINVVCTCRLQCYISFVVFCTVCIKISSFFSFTVLVIACSVQDRMRLKFVLFRLAFSSGNSTKSFFWFSSVH